MDQLLSPKQVAEAIGASESSLKRWCDQGLRILHELRSKQPPPDSGRVAIGATIEGDQYSLPVTRPVQVDETESIVFDDPLLFLATK